VNKRIRIGNALEVGNCVIHVGKLVETARKSQRVACKKCNEDENDVSMAIWATLQIARAT